jgi:hypothetical protein
MFLNLKRLFYLHTALALFASKNSNPENKNNKFISTKKTSPSIYKIKSLIEPKKKTGVIKFQTFFTFLVIKKSNEESISAREIEPLNLERKLKKKSFLKLIE